MNKLTKTAFFILVFILTVLYPNVGSGTPFQREHSLGHPAKGPLIWENDEEFQSFCSKNQTFMRMAAFQTTLPDPLPGEEYNVGLAARMLAGTVVQVNQVFSLNKTLGPRTRERGFREGPAYSGGQIIRVIGGGICKISTTLYNVAILSNLDIIERKAHGMLVPYVPPGQDATVSYGSLDFKFKNTSGYPVLIWSEKVENTLYIAFYGRNKPPKVIWHHEVLFREKMPVIYRYNPGLRLNEEKVFQSGADSIRVRNWVQMRYRDGRIEKKELGTDFYRPMLKIVETGKRRP